VDAEALNDLADAIVKLETSLGSNPQGVFGSVAARLHQFFPGGTSSPALFTFVSQTTVTIPGSTHRLGAAALRVQVYDSSIPAQAIQPNTVTIDQTTYDVTLTFAAAQSGLVLLHSGVPQYNATFTDETVVTIPGSTHQLATGALLVTVFTDADPLNILTPAAVTVDQATFDVTISFVIAASGTVILSAAGPRFQASFTNQTSFTIPGSTHQLNSRALLFQVYDALDPVNIIEPNTLTVDAGTFDVVVTFLTPQSGSLLLVKASDITGTDFLIRDAGITDSTATRVYSEAGTLNLQYGSGDSLRIENRNGTTRALMDFAGNLGLGVSPAYQLHLTGDAAKPSTNTWTISSDARLKDVLRPFTDGLAVLMQLDPVWYRYNGLGGMPQSKQEHIGVVAQAVQTVAHYLVGSYRGRLQPGAEETDILTYEGHAMTFILVNAIKELVGMLTEHATVIETLTTRLAQVETTLATLQEPSA
jgi:hypothetical protein